MQGYNTLSASDKSTMLSEIGAKSIDQLFQDVPRQLLLDHPLNLPDAHPEWQLERKLQDLAQKNANTHEYRCFLGGGKYNHFVPAVIDAIVNRGEFLTSYTPYQPEMSQGLLQALYEYQMVMSQVTGLEVVNSSCYDGATALADAAWVTCAANPKNGHYRLLVAESIWQESRHVLDTYMRNRQVEVVTVSYDRETGQIDQEDLAHKLEEKATCGFVFQSPNAFGVIEETEEVVANCRQHDVLTAQSFNPIATGLLKSPGDMGIDIATAEGQPLGIHLNSGGSSLGIFSTGMQLRKHVPGRLVGKVTDINGELAYSLVFEDREQHVAREKATSNICSNQALNAIRAGIFLSHVGQQGLGHLATINASKAEYICSELTHIPGVKQHFSGTYFNEFVVSLPVEVDAVIEKLLAHKVFAGIDYQKAFSLKNAMLISITETLTKDDLDEYVRFMKEICV